MRKNSRLNKILVLTVVVIRDRTRITVVGRVSRVRKPSKIINLAKSTASESTPASSSAKSTMLVDEFVRALLRLLELQQTLVHVVGGKDDRDRVGSELGRLGGCIAIAIHRGVGRPS